MLSPKQKYALQNATKRINLLEGAVRSGKTYVANTLYLEQLFTVPYDKFLLTGKTKDTLRRNVTLDLMKLIGEDNCEYNAHMGELSFRVGHENRKVYCIGALDERSEGRVRGGTFGSWYADEMTLHPESFCDTARTRLSVPESRIYWTCNPDSPYHPVYTDYIMKPSPDLFHCSFEINDNPYLTESFKQELRNTFTGIFARRMIKGEWVLAEGIIYDMFSSMHIVDELPDMLKFWVGVDYGTASTFVALLFGLGTDGKVYVISEWYHDAKKSRIQMTDSQYRMALDNWFDEYDVKPYILYCDPSATSFIQELRQNETKFAVCEGDNEVLDGIRGVSNAFSQFKLFVHRRCKTLIEEVSSTYCWDNRAQHRGEDRPLKKNDHRSDALRYGYYSYFLNSEPSISASSVAIKPKKQNADETEGTIVRETGFFRRMLHGRNKFREQGWIQNKRPTMLR